MLYFTGLILLAIGVSLDSFGVGVAYGVNKIRVPRLSLLIIMLCSGLVVLASMTFGILLISLISPHIAEIIGSLILISIGLIGFYNIVRTKHSNQSKESKALQYEPKEKEWKFEIQKLGLFMDVKCFLLTILCVLKKDGIVEGGTGKLSEQVNNKESITK